MNEDYIAKKLLTSSHKVIKSQPIRLFNFEISSLKAIEKTKCLSYYNPMDITNKITFQVQCECDIDLHDHIYYLFFDYYKTDKYQLQIKNYFTIFDDKYMVNQDDVVTGYAKILNIITNPSSTGDIKLYMSATRKIIAFKYFLYFSIYEDLAKEIIPILESQNIIIYRDIE